MERLTFGKPLAGIGYIDRPAAYAVILDGEGRVGVVRGRRGWFLPGGGSDPGETPEETLAREAREEIAREITLRHRLGDAVQFFSIEHSNYRLTATFYLAELGAPINEPPEYTLEWVSVDGAADEFFHECHVWAVYQGLAFISRQPEGT